MRFIAAKATPLIVIATLVFSLGMLGCSRALEGVSGETAGGSAESTEEVEGDNPYRTKAQDLIDRYGAPAIERFEGNAYISGLAFARLADFGAGRDFLVVAYLNPENDDPSYPGGQTSAYSLEIWDSRSSGEPAELIYSGKATADGQNVYCAAVHMCQVDGRSFVAQIKAYSDQPPGFVTIGLLDDDSMGERDAGCSPDDYDVFKLAALQGSVEPYYRRTCDSLAGLGIEIDDAGVLDIPSNGTFRASLPHGDYAAHPASLPCIDSVCLDGDVLSFNGEMRYSSGELNTHALDSYALMGPREWTFTVTQATKYLLYGGMAGPEETTRDQFLEYAMSLHDMGFGLKVADGKVTEVSLHS